MLYREKGPRRSRTGFVRRISVSAVRVYPDGEKVRPVCPVCFADLDEPYQDYCLLCRVGLSWEKYEMNKLIRIHHRPWLDLLDGKI